MKRVEFMDACALPVFIRTFQHKYIHTYIHKYIHRYKHTYWLGTIMDHEGHFIFTTGFRFVIFPKVPGHRAPQPDYQTAEFDFHTYKRTLHHAAMWMRTKHVEQGTLSYPRKKKVSKALLIAMDCDGRDGKRPQLHATSPYIRPPKG